MATPTFPRRHLATLDELAARVLEQRGDAAKRDLLAYDLLDGFFEVCMRAGLDGVIAELERTLAFAIPEGAALAEQPRLRAALAARLGDRAAFDPRGPRAAKLRQLAEGLLATLGLELADTPVRTFELGDDVRRATVAGIASVVEPEVSGARVRAASIAVARTRCEPRYLGAFERIAAVIGERLVVPRELKLPIDAVQVVQQELAAARRAVLAATANDAIDRAKHAIGAANAEAAAQIDLPVTARLTPREVAVQRASDARTPALGDVFSRILLDALTELVAISWGPPVVIARPYRANHTYAVGDHIDHPTFGRGVVHAATSQRIEVEFPDGRHTLIHARS